ncbi:MAG: hypothetical protein M1822_008565, partial [Bathelium mastoideum]
MPHIPDVSTLLKTRDKLKQRVQASSTQNHPDQWSSNAPNGNYEGPNGNYGSPDGGLGSQEGLKGGLESVNQLVPSSSENVLPPQYRQGNQ